VTSIDTRPLSAYPTTYRNRRIDKRRRPHLARLRANAALRAATVQTVEEILADLNRMVSIPLDTATVDPPAYWRDRPLRYRWNRWLCVRFGDHSRRWDRHQGRYVPCACGWTGRTR